LEITAAILAGGLGTRLRALAPNQPKALVQVRGRPFLACLLGQLESAGVRHAIVCTGYLAEAIEGVFGGRFGSVELEYSREAEPLGTGGAIRLALPRFRSPDVLVMNGDSYCRLDLAGFYDRHRARAAEATIGVVEVPDAGRFGRVVFDEHDRVERFEEKQAVGTAGWINAGVYVLKADWLQELAPAKPASLERDLFPRWIGRGLYADRCPGPFIDIGTPESYALAEAFFAPEEAAR